jgi:hypothetical protein
MMMIKIDATRGRPSWEIVSTAQVRARRYTLRTSAIPHVERTVMIATLISCALVLVWLPVGTAEHAVAQGQKGPAGHWVGTIAAGPGLEVEVDLAMKGNTWHGTISIPAQGTKGVPLADLVVKDTAVSFAIKGAPGDPRYAGTLSADGKSLTGDFTQGGGSMPLTLTWKGEPQFEVAQKSPPVTTDLEGAWEGSLDVKGTVLRLRLQLANGANGATAVMTSIDQGNLEIPASTIAQDGPRVKLTFNMISGTFAGELKGGEIVGTWSQGPLSLPLVFKRAAK